MTRERERRLRLWVVLGGVGGRVGAADAARRAGGFEVAIDDEAAERSGTGTGPPARALIAALVLGIAERCLGAEDNRDAQGMSR